MKVNLPIIVIVLIVLLVTSTQSSCSDKSDEEITAIAEREAYENKITFTMPIEYTATVTQCSSRDGCKTRLYYPSARTK